jgi:hypothetical protein
MSLQKLIAILLAIFFPFSLTAQTTLKGVTVRGLSVGVTQSGPPPTSGFSFLPAGGTYTSAQNVSVTYTPTGAGQDIFYTTDGSTPDAASKLLQTGSTIPVSVSTVINALVYRVGSVRQDTQLTQGLWKVCTPKGGGPGTPTSALCGGVGSTQPTGWNILWNTTVGGVSGLESISLSGNGVQILVTLGGSGCDDCTEITMDKWIKPLDADTATQNHEHDVWHNDATRNRLHMGGFQCNQQSGNPAQLGGLSGKQWQFDNEQGGDGPGGVSWVNTNVNDKCPLSTSLWTHLRVHLSFSVGDDGCGDGHTPSVHGGLGCTRYDWFEVGTAISPNNGATMAHYNLATTAPWNTLENDAKGWGSGCADQDQEDLFPGSIKTGGVLIAHNNVTCGYGTIATGSATYSF